MGSDALPNQPSAKPLAITQEMPDVPLIGEDDYDGFLRGNEFAIIVFDAPWDGHGKTLIPQIASVRAEFGDRIAIGCVNVDEGYALTASIRLLNVPSVAYCRRGCVVSNLIGASQNVLERAWALVEGKPIHGQDGLNSTASSQS